MIAYASRTGTRRNLDALRAAGWRLLVSCYGVWRTEGFEYCLDNGAWHCHQQGVAWDPARFAEFCAEFGSGADFVIAPDIVAGGLESLRLSESWLSRLGGLRLVPVQDGMATRDVSPLLGRTVGLFLGGSTEWKLSTMRRWGELAEEIGCWYHVARVNSQKRIRLAVDAGADSIDGSGPSQWRKHLAVLEREIDRPQFDWRSHRVTL